MEFKLEFLNKTVEIDYNSSCQIMIVSTIVGNNDGEILHKVALSKLTSTESEIAMLRHILSDECNWHSPDDVVAGIKSNPIIQDLEISCGHRLEEVIEMTYDGDNVLILSSKSAENSFLKIYPGDNNSIICINGLYCSRAIVKDGYSAHEIVNRIYNTFLESQFYSKYRAIIRRAYGDKISSFDRNISGCND